MKTQHVVLYVPGLGDTNLSMRQWLLNLWHFRNVSIEICSLDWTVDEPWQVKLQRLLKRVDELASAGNDVSLIGESAGATAVLQALHRQTAQICAVVILCGKSQYPERVAAARYNTNPALKDALLGSSAAIKLLTDDQKGKILNLHPLFDPVVPVAETKIPGVRDSTMPIIGHATSIVFANTLWSFKIVRFIRAIARIP